MQGISTLKDLDLLSTLLKPHIDQCAPMIKHIYLKNLNDPVMQSMLLTLASCFMDVESLNDFVINIIKYGFSVQAEQQLKKIGFPESSLLSIQKNVIHLNKQFIDFLMSLFVFPLKLLIVKFTQVTSFSSNNIGENMEHFPL